MQRFAVFDIDKTLYKGTLAHDFVDVMLEKGTISSTSPEAEQYSDAPDDKKLVSLLKAVQAGGTVNFGLYQEAGRIAGTEAAKTLNTDSERLLAEQIRLGKTIIAISTSPYAAVKPFCDTVGGFDIVVAPMAQNIDGVVGPRSIIKADERDKGEWLRRITDLYGLTFASSVAIGDSMSDAPMLELVERPIAYQPVKALRYLAVEKGWEIWG